MTQTVDRLPNRAFLMIEDERGIVLKDLGPADCVIIYSELSTEQTKDFTDSIKQSFTLIKAGVAPLELP